MVSLKSLPKSLAPAIGSRSRVAGLETREGQSAKKAGKPGRAFAAEPISAFLHLDFGFFNFNHATRGGDSFRAVSIVFWHLTGRALVNVNKTV